MGYKINENKTSIVPFQSGSGIPSHLSPRGSVYIDNLTGTEYINKDGYNTWAFLYDSTMSISGGTSSGGTITGAYLPLSGGTMTGGLVANNGVTANTISQTAYIDFATGTTNPSSVGGRVFFDNNAKALAYYDIQGDSVAIAMGQQLYTRVWNATGSQIDKGKVIAITGTSNNLPSAILARNKHEISSARPIGLAAENILNNSEGLVLNNGILSGVTLNTFSNGDTLYLSDTVAGGYVSSTSYLAFTARTNEIGYVLQTGSTTGKIYVNINNEDSYLSLTDIERNILEGNVISSGAYQYTGMTQGTGQTINVALVRGWIVKNTYDFATLPDVTNIYYTGGTNIPLTYLNTADATYILVNSGLTIVQQTTFPTPQQRRENILLGKVVHPNKTTITSLNQTVDFDVSPMAAIRDLWTPLKLINQGILVSPHSTTLEIDTSAGTLWGNGIGWVTNQANPDSVYISGTSPTTFQYRSQLGPVTGATAPYTGNTTFIDPAHYDNNGVITSVGGGSNSSTNQRVYLFPTGLVRIQYGQQVYSSLAAAVAGSQTEQFVEYGNNRDNGILIGIISVNKNTTDLSDTGYATFNFVSKFGEVMGGTGGISTTTLQQAYDNSSNPEIVINATLDGLTIKNGTGNADATTHLIEGQNTAGSVTSFITAAGGFSGSSVSAVTITTPSVTANASGLSASTISATTYYNLPTDIRVTGGTYSNGNTIFTNNTGGTFTVSGFTTATQGITGLTGSNGLSASTTNNVTTIGFSGGSINNSTNFINGLSANTFSATTYLGLPTDITVTGSTYSNNTLTFTNNTGGTFNVLFNTMTGLTVSNSFNASGSTLNVAQTINSGATGGIYSLISGNTVDSATSSRSVRALDLNIDNLSGTVKSQLIFTNSGTLSNSTLVQTPSLFINRVSGSAGFGALYFSDSGTIRAGIRNNTSGLIDIGSFSTGGWIPTFYSNNAEAARFGTTGNFLIGTTTDGTGKLQVNGTVRVFNSSVTGSTSLTIANTAANTQVITGGPAGENITFGPSNRIFLNAGQVSLGSFYLTNVGTLETINKSGSAGDALLITGQGSLLGAAGITQNLVRVAVTVAQQQASPVANIFHLNPTLNNSTGTTGTAIIRGIYYNPVVTNLTNTTHRAFENTTGDNYFNSTSGNTGIGVAPSSTYKLDVSGNTRISGNMVVSPVTGSTIIGLTISGQNTKGGTGYTDFLLVTNTNTGATNPNKYFRLNSIGGLEILNSVYTASTLTLTDTGILSVGGGNLATTSSSDGVTNYLMFGNNNTQIYDDGNTHIHSRDASKAMWINTNGGQLNLLTQSPTSTGGIGSGIAIATGTLNGYVTINTGTTISTAAAYGYLTTAGAGTYPGGSQSVPISLYATNRIWGQEIDAFSDERMKNIMGEINLEDGINLVKKLKPIKYTWKEGEDKGVKAGYSAQQVSKSGFNHLISLIPRDGLEETIDDDGFLSPKNTQFSMNYDQVTPYHGVVIKYLLEKIEALEKEINELKNK